VRSFTSTLAIAAALVAVTALGGCSATDSSAAASDGRIVAIGAENQYADVISQLGGKYVSVSSIMSNPNTDPHTFEASASVAARVSAARLIVQNGLGYDDFMQKIESASNGSNRTVIVAQDAIGLKVETRNPHLWYSSKYMSTVAAKISSSLAAIQPSHKAYFAARLTTFRASIASLNTKIATFRSAHGGTTVATTEPVADYLLTQAGIRNLTPWAYQASVMNDTDPAPQDVSKQQQLFSDRRVSVFVYNRQVTDAITSSSLALAAKNHIPVVGVYETMPGGEYTYQTWMLAELNALDEAVTHGKSTTKL
jgi:zinc/manganese transport system substrate-binding protein